MVAVAYILTIMMAVSGLFHKLYKDPVVLQWAGVWAGITCVAFFIGNTAILMLTILLLGIYFAPKNPVQRIAWFFALYPVVPMAIVWEVPGPPGVNLLFAGPPALFAQLGLFVPVLFQLLDGKGPDRRKFLVTVARTPVERWVWFFLLYNFAWSIFNMSSVTTTMRECLGHIFYVLTFFIFARCIRNLDDFKTIFKAVLFGACVVACLGIFERLRIWNPYVNLPGGLDIEPSYRMPLFRGGLLRIQSSLGQAIVFGYYMAMAVGVSIFVYQYVHRSRIYALITLGMVALACFFALSKGPWMAGAVMLSGMCLFKVVKPGTRKLLMMSLIVVGLLAYIELTSINQGETAASGGAVASDYDSSVNYRKRLVDAGWITMQDNLLFGTPYAMEHPAMQSMRQGQGIIDLVNVYVALGIFKGITGVLLFLTIIATAVLAVYNLIKDELTPESAAIRDLGAMLISSVVGTAIMLYSMSEMGIVHDYFWLLLGMCAAYRTVFVKVPIRLPGGRMVYALKERFPSQAVVSPAAAPFRPKPALLGAR